MVTNEEFGQLIAEFESFRDLVLEELAKLKDEIEKIKDNIKDIEDELTSSGRTLKKRIG